MIIGISGQAGSGKDTIADLLVKKYRFVRVGLADPLKRICKEVYDFSDEQLWGPSDFRNAGDRRYPRVCNVCGKVGDPDMVCTRHEGFLSPRYALQTLGTEWGRDCYGNTWIEYGIRVAKRLEEGYARYTVQQGLIETEKDVGEIMGVVFSDLRFKNEIDAIAGVGKVVRVKRPGYHGGVGIAGHASEEEQKTFRDDQFHYVVENTGTLDDLALKVDYMMHNLARAA